MKPTESQIENLLRQGAASGESRRIEGQINRADQIAATVGDEFAREREFVGAAELVATLVAGARPATASLALAAVIAVQQNEITALQATVRDLNATLTAATNNAATQVKSAPPTSTVTPGGSEAEELARLQQRVATLSGEIGRFETLQKANEGLRTQLATPAGLSQQELDALAEAKARAQAIACVNNLKQIGLAVRIYANDNNEISPPDFLAMSNELSTPKILFCPGDTNHPPVKTWAEFATTTSTYEYLAAGITNADLEPQRILTRCPIHNNIGLCDGSVQRVSKQHPEFIVERDGKLYLEMNARPAQPTANP